MIKSWMKILLLVGVLGFGRLGLAQDVVPTEDDYYPITTLPIPEGVVLEVGGIAQLPEGKLARD